MTPMRLLIWLSIAYAAVLVLALAVSLVLILLYLLRVRAALQPIASALGDVAERTAALEGVMHGMADAVSHVQDDIGTTADEVVRAGGVLGVKPPESPPAQAGAVARWQQERV
jgi:hypothetical protein